MNVRDTLVQAIGLMEAGDTLSAEAALKALVLRYPGQADALHMLGICSLNQGRAAQAVDWFQRALQRHAHNPDYHVDIANALLMLGQESEARAHYEAALGLAPDHFMANFNLGTVLLRQGHSVAALKYLRAAAKAGTDADAQVNLAEALVRTRRSEEAEEALHSALRIAPRHPLALAGLGRLFSRAGRHEEALCFLELATAYDPQLPDVAREISQCLAKLGRQADALAVLERTLPKTAQMWADLESLHATLGHVEEAARCRQEALRLSSGPAASHSHDHGPDHDHPTD